MAKRQQRGVGSATRNCLKVIHLGATQRDVAKIGLNEGQALHLWDLGQGLRSYYSPYFHLTYTIEKHADDLFSFYERGGTLGNCTIRSYFGVDDRRNEAVVAGYEKVQLDGGPKPHVIEKMRNRLIYYFKKLAK